MSEVGIEEKVCSWVLAIGATILLAMFAWMAAVLMVELFLWAGLWGILVGVVSLYTAWRTARAIYNKLEA